MLLHSPIRDVYLCIQGFDSRLACRICNNTVQSSIRADGLSVDREKRRWREFDKERKKGEKRIEWRGTGEEKRGEETVERQSDSAEVFGKIPVSPEETNCNRELPVSTHSCCWLDSWRGPKTVLCRVQAQIWLSMCVHQSVNTGYVPCWPT